MLRILFFLSFLLLFSRQGTAQPRTDSLLQRILQRRQDPALQRVLKDPKGFRCQVIYTQIERNRHNEPRFRNYYFNYDPGLYYYPASTVKLPLAAMALEKLNALQYEGIGKHTTVFFDSSYPGQKALDRDTTAETGQPSIAQFIRRALLISENDPYNRLYQFVGQQGINRSLRRKGYRRSRIVKQFMGFNEDQNRHTNGVRFIGPDDRTLYYQPPAYNRDSIDFGPAFLVGRGYLNRNDSLVQAPLDFTRHNYMPLGDLQELLQTILFPNSVGKRRRFHLSGDDYRFLYRCLSQYPSETPYPRYDSSVYYDTYVKFFFGDSAHRKMPEGVRVFNKVGWAYGFLTDVAYVADFANGIEYMLTATVYANSDGILNDDKYEYGTVGLPFMRALGQAVYQYELRRPRKRRPDLSQFRIEYEHRDPDDRRPQIKAVDN